MPIHGLSEQRRLPRLGKIRLGIKVTKKRQDNSEYTYPSAVDYFVLPEELKKYLGEKPTEIPIMIPVEDDEVWCNQYYKCYSYTRGLTCRGDGVTCRRMVDMATGDKAGKDTKGEVTWKEGLSCDGRNCNYYKADDCKETMNLQFIMPDIPGLGVWQIDTGSINSIRNINNAAAMVRAVYKRISFIPLTLTLEEQEVVNPDDGKKKKVHVLNLRTRGTLKELMLEASKPVSELLIPPPADDEAPMDNPENGKVIEGEVVKPTPEQIKQAEKDVNELFPDGKPPKKATPKAEQKTTIAGIDMSWLTDTFTKIHWRKATAESWLAAQFKVQKEELDKMLPKLTEEQKKTFLDHINNMAEASGK